MADEKKTDFEFPRSYWNNQNKRDSEKTGQRFLVGFFVVAIWLPLTVQIIRFWVDFFQWIVS